MHTTTHTTTDNQAVTRTAMLDALHTWITQRPGLEYANYGDATSYRAELRHITRDLHDARALLGAVARTSAITPEALTEAARRAFSGRLSFKDISARYDDGSVYVIYRVNYCTGQYWPTEYRAAAAAVLAQALWTARADSMPPVSAYQVRTWYTHDADGRTIPPQRKGTHATRAEAEAEVGDLGGPSVAHVQELHDGQTAGDWLRQSFRREFGRGMQARWWA